MRIGQDLTRRLGSRLLLRPRDFQMYRIVQIQGQHWRKQKRRSRSGSDATAGKEISVPSTTRCAGNKNGDGAYVWCIYGGALSSGACSSAYEGQK